MSRSDYWDMTPKEAVRIMESKRPKHIGSLHEDDFDNILARRKELERKGVKLL